MSSSNQSHVKSTTEKRLLEVQGNTAILTINNPPANTWDDESLPALKKLIEDLNADLDIYALVVTGQGQKVFSAGADLNKFAEGDKAVARHMARIFGEAFETLQAFRGGSMAEINGYAMGGRLESALACQIRIAEEQAQMALPEAAVGLRPCAGSTQNLSWLGGEGWAKRMILCGERVTAEKAEKIGLVEEVVAKGEALATAIALAEKGAKQSPVAVSACKTLVHNARGNNSLAVGCMQERELFVDLFHTQDQKEGVNAFLEKRKPEWKNA